jgi:uncharacterized membrane protein
MARALALASLAWPLLLGAALGDRLSHPSHAWSAAVYVAAGQVCHQRPDRSFTTRGVQWPVCGRCAGLYLAAPFGAVVGLRWRRRSGAPMRRRWLVLAAAPTVMTLLWEWMRLTDVSSIARGLAALPLGAAIAGAIVRIAPGRSRPIG